MGVPAKTINDNHRVQVIKLTIHSAEAVERREVNNDKPQWCIDVYRTMTTKTERERGMTVELVRVDTRWLTLHHDRKTSLEFRHVEHLSIPDTTCKAIHM